MAYVRRRRLDQARADLISAGLTATEAAGQWHFADSSHFAKAYKRQFSESPTAERRSSMPQREFPRDRVREAP
ncbi:helix-turn-helix domain-containing protein [Kineosporia babensis]|uniref:Helix-turn-helix domain-containing protein n=1 Tax=Kineosporia babensis TaxID=499548 RepID=A0A9X1NG87_9ACTN|nr:helix-turn-helix domain-containing protein [Kineosporia babensis]MCD5312741.1 helix-turn-helix domain-containing protein [Kineosporia babensis]